MSEGQKSVETWIAKVKEAFQAGDDVLTQSILEEAICETDSDPKLMEIGGMIAYTRGDMQECIRLIESAMFHIRLTISGQLTIANAWLATGEKERARMTLAFLVEIVDRVPCRMLPDLTNALSGLEEYELALAVCRQAFERHPDDDNAVFGAAFYMHRAGYPPQLVYGAMAKAVALDPGSDLYRLNISIVCCSLQRWDEAYRHACRLPLMALETIPCKCMAVQMKELFQRFEDIERRARVEMAI